VFLDATPIWTVGDVIVCWVGRSGRTEREVSQRTSILLSFA
jgi:hypothetical protein